MAGPQMRRRPARQAGRRVPGALTLTAFVAGGALLALGAALGCCWAALPALRGERARTAWRLGRTRRAAFDIQGALGGMFSSQKQPAKVEVPKDVSEVVAGLKASTEAALNQGISRLDVELPPAYQLGVEQKDKRQRLLEVEAQPDNVEAVARGDRELARVFVEMFHMQLDGLCIAFRTKALATAAKNIWKLDKSEGTVISFPEAKAKSAFAAEVGAPSQFKSKLEALGCQCLLVVAPYAEQLRLVRDLGEIFKDQMGIILLNARITGIGRTTMKMPSRLKKELLEEFVPSYHIRFLALKNSLRKNTLLFHLAVEDGQGPWIVAQQRELIGGSPVTQEVLRKDSEPTPEEVEEAFEKFDTQERGVADKLLDIVDKDKLRR